MFGHLKPADFVNLMEGGEPTTGQRTHLDSCARCREVWNASKPLYAGMTSLDSEMVEPDWEEFRSSVRDRLLSRSIQRQTSVRRWTGWAVRPGMAWALSLLLAVGIPTGAFLWHLDHENKAATAAQSQGVVPAATLFEATSDKTVFDDVIQLTDMEQAQLQQLLESAQGGSSRVQ